MTNKIIEKEIIENGIVYIVGEKNGKTVYKYIKPSDIQPEPVEPEPTQLDNIEESILMVDENTLTIMEGIAFAYEAEQSNSMDMMEGLAAIYEAQLLGGTE